jgi:hypothetical protein
MRLEGRSYDATKEFKVGNLKKYVDLNFQNIFGSRKRLKVWYSFCLVYGLLALFFCIFSNSFSTFVHDRINTPVIRRAELECSSKSRLPKERWVRGYRLNMISDYDSCLSSKVASNALQKNQRGSIAWFGAR